MSCISILEMNLCFGGVMEMSQRKMETKYVLGKLSTRLTNEKHPSGNLGKDLQGS